MSDRVSTIVRGEHRVRPSSRLINTAFTARHVRITRLITSHVGT